MTTESPTRPARAESRRALRLPALSRKQAFVLWGLVVLVMVSALEVIVHINHPVPYYADDTPSYIYAAEGVLYHGQFADFYRGPAYPAVMALTAIFTGTSSDVALYVINQALYVVASLEIFAFIGIATKRPAVAGLVALLAGLYFYPLSYDNLLLGDSFSAFMLPTLVLSVALFLARPRALTVWGVTLASAVLSLSLSEWFFFPVALFAYLGWMTWRRGLLRSLWMHLAGGLAALLALIGVYIEANGRQNGYFGISFIQNPDLLGKVMQYKMSGAGSNYAWLDQLVRQYEAGGNTDPFWFGFHHPDVSRDFWALGGSYARAVILQHPLQFVGDTLRLILSPVVAWPIEFVSPTGRFFHALTIWETIGHGAYQLLVFALVFALAWAVLLFVRPTARLLMTEIMGVIALLALFDRSITVAVVYSDYQRLQAPTAQLATVLTYGSFVLAIALIADLRSGRGLAASMAQEGEAPLDGNHALPRFGPTSEAIPTSSDRNAAATMDSRPTLADSASSLDSLDSLDSLAALESPTHRSYAPFPEHPEISIVLPCLNEEEAIGGCIDTLQHVIATQRLSAEIVVVDNASTDRSAEIASAHGARVVYQPVRGYGNAYLKGFAEARGDFIVMADADNTYDLSEVNDFVQPLREGYDLVMGNRFAGRMAKGAMTFSHRYIGNPILSGILRLFFGATVRDAHCGMRAFTRASYPRMRLRTGGMEFASEMVINAAKARLKIAERPISYAPRIGESKLHTVRDGWRHLRFMLLYSPTHLFLLPGIFLLLLGLGVEIALAPGPLPLFGHYWDVHTMLLGSVVALLGVQIIMLGLFARFFSLTEELDGEHDAVLRFMTRAFTLERGLLIGGVILALGFGLDAFVLGSWIASGAGQLALVRPTVLGSTGIAIGAEIMFGSFFLSFLQFSKTLHDPAAPLEDATSVRIPARAGERK